MKPLRIFLLFAALLCAGCDRNQHPRMIGSPAPDFTVHDSDRTVSLHDLRGQVVLLNFWTSWCQPCIEETPALKQLHAQMGDKVKILAVSLDKSDDAYHDFLKENQIAFLTVRDAASASGDLYAIDGYPETFVIDRQGVIRRKFVGPVDWTAKDVTDYLQKL